jgi:hypothetical protein
MRRGRKRHPIAGGLISGEEFSLIRGIVTDLGQFCADEDPNTVIVVLEVADIARAKAYWLPTCSRQGASRRESWDQSKQKRIRSC